MEFKKGNKINYTVTKKIGKGYSISSKDGIYFALLDEDFSKIKEKNGRIVIVKNSRIRHANKPNALTEALINESKTS